MVQRNRTGAVVTITTRSLWRIRLGRELLRYLLCAASLGGLAASVRFVLAPPRSLARVSSVSALALPDRAAEGYATLFARRYLTWNAAAPQAGVRSLQSLVGPGMEANAGLGLPPSGEQRVEWAEVVQEREPLPGEHV